MTETSVTFPPGRYGRRREPRRSRRWVSALLLALVVLAGTLIAVSLYLRYGDGRAYDVTVTRFYDVRLADLQSKKRSQSIALPRQVCMYLARNLTRHSLEEIGGHLGGRDHSTVLHAYTKIDELRRTDARTRGQIDQLIATIKPE